MSGSTMLNRSRPIADAEVSHNVLGQRLGRKGQETRERILTAFERLLTGPAKAPITLSAVAREASTGMSTLYLYFPDHGALVLAGLLRLAESARSSFVETVRLRWADEALPDKCLEFARQYFQFWSEHARLLHMRNSLADANDPRFLEARHQTTMPMIDMLIRQMDANPEADEFASYFSMVVLTGVERICTVVTNPYFPFRHRDGLPPIPDHVEKLIRAEARLIEVAIRHQREVQAGVCG